MVQTPLTLLVYHCCQLKSSFDPKTRKKPRMVAKMTILPVETSAHAPQAICKHKQRFHMNSKCLSRYFKYSYNSGDLQLQLAQRRWAGQKLR